MNTKNIIIFILRIILLIISFCLLLVALGGLNINPGLTVFLSNIIILLAYRSLFQNQHDAKCYYMTNVILKGLLVFNTFLAVLFVGTIIPGFDLFTLFVAIASAYFSYRKLFPKATKKMDHNLPPLSHKRQKIYQESGLSEEEIIFFRQELAKAKKQLVDIEASFWRNNKLTAIARRHNMVAILRDYFKELADNPKRLNEGTDFLYSYIPSLHDLIEKYIEIDQHVSKTQLTYRTLSKTAETIEQLCQTIEDDYLAFQKDDFKDAEIEIELARQKMKQATTTQAVHEQLDEQLEDDDFENSFDNF